MNQAQDYYPSCPEAMIVSMARTGDRSAFEELVRRRQSWIRNLMRRFCGDVALADDLAQQVFLQLWLKVHTLREANAFGAWLKRLAVTVWLQHLRKHDPLHDAEEFSDAELAHHDASSESVDLDQALATLSTTVRLCIVLSYHEGASHREIAELTELPLGTVKSHISRGTKHLRQILSAYQNNATAETPR